MLSFLEKLASQNIVLILFSVIAIGWCALRLAFLETSPPGFYIDEAGEAAVALCTADRGEGFYEPLAPFFARGPAGGRFSPIYVYFAALWSKVFGPSIYSFRSIPAFFNVLTIIAIFLIAQQLIGSTYAVFAALIAALQPWGFQFSRIAWDPPLMVCFMCWGIFVFLNAKRIRYAVLAGILFSLALYSYQAAKAFLPLYLFALLLMPKFRPFRSRYTFSAFAITCISCCLPLVLFTFSQTGMSRFNQVSILSKHYFQNALDGSYFNLLTRFLSNMGTHLSLDFLFIKGDANLRHSPPFIGQLGYIELLALILFLVLVFQSLCRLKSRTLLFRSLAKRKNVLMFSSIGAIAALIPAALTHEGIPHALRGIASWPFFALFFATLMFIVDTKWKSPRLLYLVMAIWYSVSFASRYFENYPKQAASYFDLGIVQEAKAAKTSRDWKQFIRRHRHYDRAALAYYLMSSHIKDCHKARQFVYKISHN